MLNALLKPEAKKPPKGAMRDAKMERGREWSMAGYATKLTPSICTQGNHGRGVTREVTMVRVSNTQCMRLTS